MSMVETILRKLAVATLAAVAAVVLLTIALCLLAYAGVWQLSLHMGPGAAAAIVGGGILLVMVLAALLVWFGGAARRRRFAAHAASGTPLGASSGPHKGPAGLGDPATVAADAMSGWVHDNPKTAVMAALGAGAVLGASPGARRLVDRLLDAALRELQPPPR